MTFECRLCLAITIVFLLVILVPLSFSRVHYYEYGLAKSRTTGTIDRTTVFGPGLHMIGPDNFFVTFEASELTVELNDLSVWSRATRTDPTGSGPDMEFGENATNPDDSEESAGTEMNVNLDFRYRLIQDRLVNLFNKVGVEHKSFVRNIMVSVLKNNATRFSADDYLQKRAYIQSEFFKAFKAEGLSAADIEVTNLNLKHVKFPESVYSRKLDAAVQNQKNLIEEYLRKAALVRGNTQVSVLEIENDAQLIKSQADSEASLIKKNATNEAVRITYAAEREGLKTVSDKLEITDEKQLLSLNYLIKLQRNDANIKKYVNFSPSHVLSQ